MALHLGFKIIRNVKVGKSRCLYNICSYSSQPKAKSQKPYFKAASTLTQNKVKDNENVSPTIIPSELKNRDVILRRKFAKSSTHSALTQPLKLPRLANPFPDPVKTLRSDTVSEDEKARLMDEQIKMEARFHLQMQQEMQQTPNIYSQSNKSKPNTVSNTPVNYQSDQFNTLQNKKQPVFKKPKRYDELTKEAKVELQESSQQDDDAIYVGTGNVKPFKKFPLNIPNKTMETVSNTAAKKPVKTEGREKFDQKNVRGGRKSHTRAAKYLRHSWYPRHYRNRQAREYSTINCHLLNPEMKSDSERCDMIIKALKQAYPEEYKTLEKPVLIPGSAEEKEFINNILRILAKRKISELSNKKNKAPFPSYSEVRTFISEAKLPENNPNCNPSKDLTNNIIFNNGFISRCYSTGDVISEPVNIPPESSSKIPLTPKNDLNENTTEKLQAPYQSFSELYLDEHSQIGESHNCAKDVNRKSYSRKVSDVEVKKKPPCKNPFTVPECDYVKTIKQKDENKKKKHCPKNKKCDSDTSKIIDKLKSWFSTYKPESNNIKVSRSPIDVDGRETYVVEVNDYVDLNYNLKPDIAESTNYNNNNSKLKMKNVPFKKLCYQPVENKYSHLPEMTDIMPVLTKNIPDFNCTNQLPQDDNKILDDAKVTLKKFKYDKPVLEFNAKQIKLNQEVVKQPVVEIKKGNRKDKIKDILNKSKTREVSKVNLVKENFLVKPKTVRNMKPEKQIKPQMYYNKSINLHQPRASMSPGCDTTKDNACNKKEKDECPKKKCRPLKKRKPPKCDDVKGNKSCSSSGTAEKEKKFLYSLNLPVFPLVQNPLEYVSNHSEKVDSKNTNSINNYINLKPKIEILANQQTSTNINEPFKLKPQFWKK